MQGFKRVGEQKKLEKAYRDFKILLTKKDVKFSELCRQCGILRQSGQKALKGKLNGEKGRFYRETLTNK
jgi:hypothetical protein